MDGPATAPGGRALPDQATLIAIEDAAVELARLAGAEIVDALEREITVQYKQEPRGDAEPRDPVSDVDHAVEALIRERLAERFPDHAIVGEETDDHPAPAQEFIWVVDPVDGTTNFVNGFPLFAASIGVLYRGWPVVGAIWCSTGHELRPGVYHARHGGELRFEQHPVPAGRPNSGVRRRLAAAPGGAAASTRHWDNRSTGSAAIECAFVAAGIFTTAVFWGPAIWDVGAGAVLVEAAGLELWTRGPGTRGGRGAWERFERFAPPQTVEEEREPSLRDWRRPLLIGGAEAIRQFQESARRPGLWSRLRRRLRSNVPRLR